MINVAINLAPIVAEKVSSDIEIRVALIGLTGVFIGIVGQGFIEWMKGTGKRQLDAQREQLLKTLLMDTRHEWRKLNTLSRIIGANEEETRRLLIKVGARGSEKDNKDNEVWALIQNQPLNKTEK